MKNEMREFVTLICLNSKSAKKVIEAASRPGDEVHTVDQNGANVVIGYYDKRWPLDVAEWAASNGHASDGAAARVIASL